MPNVLKRLSCYIVYQDMKNRKLTHKINSSVEICLDKLPITNLILVLSVKKRTQNQLIALEA